MLHKAPGSFGLGSFLLSSGLESREVLKSILYFTISAPMSALLTFLVVRGGLLKDVSRDTLALCLLFSAGTFLYVATAHILPEVSVCVLYTVG